MWQLPSYPRSYDGDSNNNDSDYGSNQSAGWDAYDDGAMPKLERAFGATGQLVRGGKCLQIVLKALVLLTID